MLHDLLLGKDVTNFWKTQNSKFLLNVNSKLVDGTTGSQFI